MYKGRGFTLIELLVVVAIIGILAAVVMANLSNARSKGNDAGILANITSVTTQAGVYIGDHEGDYGTFDNGSDGAKDCPLVGDISGTGFFYDPTVENALAAALTDSPKGKTFCYANGDQYAVAVSRPASVAAIKSTFWCADSTGLRCGSDGYNGDRVTPIYNGACAPCTVNN
jgi:prepilin-type N-terminal cleavage/methylation domain-containing protein